MVDLVIGFLPQTTTTIKMGHKASFGGSGYDLLISLLILDCGDDFVVNAYVQTHQTVYSKYAQFLGYQLYLNKVA